MCNGFVELANLVVDDEQHSRSIMEWITVQCKDFTTTKSSAGSNSILQNTAQVEDQSSDLPKLLV